MTRLVIAAQDSTRMEDTEVRREEVPFRHSFSLKPFSKMHFRVAQIIVIVLLALTAIGFLIPIFMSVRLLSFLPLIQLGSYSPTLQSID